MFRDKRIDKARESFNFNRFEEANQICDSILNDNPKEEKLVQALFLKGQSLHKMERYDEAIPCYSKITELTPGNLSIFVLQGLANFEIKQFNEALKLFTHVISKDSNNSQAIRGKLAIFKEINKFEEYNIHLKKAMRLTEKKSSPSIVAFTVAMSKFNKEEAQDLNFNTSFNEINKIYEQDPEDHLSYLGKSIIFSTMGDFKNSIKFSNLANSVPYPAELPQETLSKAYAKINRNYTPDPVEFDEFRNLQDTIDQKINENPNNLYALMMKGFDLNGIGKFEEAIEIYDKVIIINSNSSKVYLFKAISLFNQGDLNDAVNNIKKALELNPFIEICKTVARSILQDVGRFLLFLEEIKFEKELVQLEEKIVQENSNIDAWQKRGFTLRSLGKYRAALRTYDKVLEIDPSFSLAYFGKAQIYTKLYNYQEAINNCEKVLELNPENDGAKNILKEAKKSLTEEAEPIQETIFDLERYLEDDPIDVELRYKKGLAASKLNQNEVALMLYDEAIKIDPDHENAYFGKALVHNKTGNFQEVINNCEKVLELNPNNEGAQHFLDNAIQHL